jgi:hypothetical protein
VEHYEIIPIQLPLSSLEKQEMQRFSLKFCVGGSSIEKFECRATVVIGLCVSVISISNYHTWMGFIQTYQKARAAHRIPTPKPISL